VQVPHLRDSQVPKKMEEFRTLPLVSMLIRIASTGVLALRKETAEDDAASTQ
jgi:hypothetical protein